VSEKPESEAVSEKEKTESEIKSKESIDEEIQEIINSPDPNFF